MDCMAGSLSTAFTSALGFFVVASFVTAFFVIRFSFAALLFALAAFVFLFGVAFAAALLFIA